MILNSVSFDGVVQFFTVFVIFIFVLALTYFTTKWIGSYQKRNLSQGNIKIIESLRVSNNKVIDIVKAGDKSFLIAVCKDTVTFIGEVNEDSLELKETKSPSESFGTVFNRFVITHKDEANDEEK